MASEIKYLTKHELENIFNAIEKSKSRHKVRDIAIIKIAYFCALRASEVGKIKYSDYNKELKQIYCNRLSGGISNIICLDNDTALYLNKYIEKYKIQDEEILFKSQEGSAISRKTLDMIIKKYCKIAEIEDIDKHHFHILKHTRAMHLVEIGLSIDQLSCWLGHKNLNNSSKYYEKVENIKTLNIEEMTV